MPPFFLYFNFTKKGERDFLTKKTKSGERFVPNSLLFFWIQSKKIILSEKIEKNPKIFPNPSNH